MHAGLQQMITIINDYASHYVQKIFFLDLN